MPGLYYKKFAVTGVANTLTLDSSGLESTQDAPKHLVAILARVTGIVGNDVELWREREQLAEVPDWLFDTEANDGDTSTPYSTTKLNRLEVDLDIPIGETVKAGLDCAGTTKNLSGAYVYRIRR